MRSLTLPTLVQATLRSRQEPGLARPRSTVSGQSTPERTPLARSCTSWPSTWSSAPCSLSSSIMAVTVTVARPAGSSLKAPAISGMFTHRANGACGVDSDTVSATPVGLEIVNAARSDVPITIAPRSTGVVERTIRPGSPLSGGPMSNGPLSGVVSSPSQAKSMSRSSRGRIKEDEYTEYEYEYESRWSVVLAARLSAGSSVVLAAQLSAGSSPVLGAAQCRRVDSHRARITPACREEQFSAS